MKLNVGCGPVRFEGEIGVDKYPGEAVDVVADMMELPYPDCSIEFIRMEHVLEHLPAKDAVPALLEAWRVLEVGGKIRVTVPDFKAGCHEYLEAKGLGEKALMLRWFYGSQAHAGEYHQSGWDLDTLGDLLQTVGFRDVRPAVDPTRTEGIGIYAEGVK